MRKIIISAIITILTPFLTLVSHADTQVYDLTADWSATSNPNGQWSWSGFIYKDSEGSMIVGFPNPPGAYWSTPFVGLAVWTAPESGTIDISGAMWDLCEGPLAGAYWFLWHNGNTVSWADISGGSGAPIPFSAGLEGAEVLQDISVAAGDQVVLEIGAFYGGVEFTIAFTPSAADPIQALEALQAAVLALNLQNGIENSLDNKLDAALNALDDLNANNNAAACNSLDAFINAVEAQRDNKITSAQADQLIASAQQIQAMLTCGN